jgi:hypothetical protein
MKNVARLSGALLLAALLLTLFAVTLAVQPGVAAQSAPQGTGQSDLPVGGMISVGASVNLTTQSALSPALAILPGEGQPWVAYVQNNRVLVSALVSDTWQPQDGALNRSLANVAQDPAIDFAGPNRDQAWVAWVETVAGTPQVMAARFNGTNWALTAVLNRHPAQSAGRPDLTAGSTVSGTAPLPWAVWPETAANGSRQIVVSRAVANAGAPGGFEWVTVDGALNLDPARNGAQPELAFAGPGHTQPWVVWQEEGGDRPTRIFAKRLVANAWQSVGRQEACGTNELACALNLDAQQNAQQPSIAVGQLSTDTVPTPWIAFAEASGGGSQIQVMRLDVGTPDDPSDDRFVPVGGSVNAQCLGRTGESGGRGSQPDLYFVGLVPHIAWVEQQGSNRNLFVCHLANPLPGQERWDLDTVLPVNRAGGAPANLPSLRASDTTPYVAWQEGDGQSNIFVARRYPPGPAWGQNFPPALEVISGTQAAALPPDLVVAAGGSQRSGPVLVTTSAYHAEGWEHIDEVQFALVSGDQTVFLARYVVSEDKVYVQDPDSPGVFFPGVTPGPGSPSIPTRFVSLATALMDTATYGAESPTVDVQWALVFEDRTFFNRYAQALNILYADGQQTGFFQVGDVFVGKQAFLPLVVNVEEGSQPASDPAIQ